MAQNKGAKGVIIATQGYEYSEGNIYLGDDGNGRKVHITSIFINYATFEKLNKLKSVEIIANYPIPKSSVSTLSIFLSASKRSSYVFLRELKEKYPNIKDFIKIEPVYHTITC